MTRISLDPPRSPSVRWCLDLGFWASTTRGIDAAELREVPRWRDNDVVTDLGRDVLAYAEAVTTTRLEVTDGRVAGPRRHLDDAQLVELTMMISVENSRSRFDSALGLTGQGFRDRSEVPAR